MEVVSRILSSAAYAQRPEEFIQERAMKEAKRKKKILLCDGWQWREEGLKVFNEFKDTFSAYSSILKPREHFKHVLTAVKFHAEVASAVDRRSVRYRITNPVIGSIVGEDRRRGCKSFLMRWRFRVLRQLRTQQDDLCIERDSLGVMLQSLERCMLIPKSKCMTLRMRRERFAKAVERRDHLAHLIKRCESIDVCRSRTHRNPEGCQRCPVIFIRNEAMIRAIDRGNNLPVVVAIEHEHRLLQSEYAKQSQYTVELEDVMQSLREVMEKKMIYDMQAWYACRLAHRATAREHDRMEISMYYYRIRKLVRMKRKLDILNYKIPTAEELSAFEITYSDLANEASAYRRELSIRKRYIEDKYSRPMWDKLMKLFAARKEMVRKEENEKEIARRREQRARQEKRRRKMLNIAEDTDDSEEAVKARLLEKMRIMKSKRFICHYVDCHKREFQSQRRLDIHLTQHRRQQMELQKIRAMHAQNKQRREEEERVFLGRLAALRMLKANLSATNSIEKCSGPSRLQFLEYIIAPIDKMNKEQQIELARAADATAADADIEYGEMGGQDEHYDYNYSDQYICTDLDDGGESHYHFEAGSDEERSVQNPICAELSDQSQNDVAVEEDELDPFYDADSTFDTTVNQNKIDILDEQFMLEMDAELLKVPKQSYDEDSLLHQYSMAELVPSEDYNDILGIDSCGDEDVNYISEAVSEEVEDMVDGICVNNSFVDVSGEDRAMHSDSDLSSTITAEVITTASLVPKAKGFATLKLRFNADVLASEKETSQIATLAVPTSHYAKPTFAERFKKNRIDVPSSQSELRLDLISCNAISEEKFTWMRQQRHIGMVFENLRLPMKHLELLSKHPDVECPYRVPLVAPLMRMGTLETNEVVFNVRGVIKKEGRVAKQHVVIYVPLHTEFKDLNKSTKKKDRSLGTRAQDSFGAVVRPQTSTISDEDGINAVDNDVETIVDNHTIWGTYLVSVAGVRKVPTITSGYTQSLFSGDLLCIGVRWRGPDTLTAVEASSAVMVYRVRCCADTNEENL